MSKIKQEWNIKRPIWIEISNKELKDITQRSIIIFKEIFLASAFWLDGNCNLLHTVKTFFFFKFNLIIPAGLVLISSKY